MRLLAAALLVISVGCGPVLVQAPDPAPNSSTPLDPEHAVRIFSVYGFASACAVGNYIYTAQHVLMPFTGVPFLHDAMVSYAWSDESGREGRLDALGVSPYRDLGVLVPAFGDTPVYQKAAWVPPLEGETVRWIEYSLETEETDFFAPVERSGTVLRQVAGHVAFDMSPAGGASGTCLYNSAGDVVGIVMWGFPETGVAVLLTGQWAFE